MPVDLLFVIIFDNVAPFLGKNKDNTVLVLIKLTKFAVALRLRCGSCKLKFGSGMYAD